MRRDCPARAPCAQSAINSRRPIDLPVTPYLLYLPSLALRSQKGNADHSSRKLQIPNDQFSRIN